MIMTDHELQQKSAVSRPLWPIYSVWPHCSGPCQQGRSVCMTPESCQTGLADPDDERKPMTGRHRLWLVVIAILSVGAVYFAAMGLLPHVMALGRAIVRGWS